MKSFIAKMLWRLSAWSATTAARLVAAGPDPRDPRVVAAGPDPRDPR